MAEAGRVPSNAIAEEEHGPYDDATGTGDWTGTTQVGRRLAGCLIRNLRPPMVELTGPTDTRISVPDLEGT